MLRMTSYLVCKVKLTLSFFVKRKKSTLTENYEFNKASNTKCFTLQNVFFDFLITNKTCDVIYYNPNYLP